jgi:hypothetical protein
MNGIFRTVYIILHCLWYISHLSIDEEALPWHLVIEKDNPECLFHTGVGSGATEVTTNGSTSRGFLPHLRRAPAGGPGEGLDLNDDTADSEEAALPIQQASLAFEELDYFVPAPKVAPRSWDNILADDRVKGGRGMQWQYDRVRGGWGCNWVVHNIQRRAPSLPRSISVSFLSGRVILYKRKVNVTCISKVHPSLNFICSTAHAA